MMDLKIGMTKTELCSHDNVFREGIVVYIDHEKYVVKYQAGYRECFFRDENRKEKFDARRRSQGNKEVN